MGSLRGYKSRAIIFDLASGYMDTEKSIEGFDALKIDNRTDRCVMLLA